MNMSKLGTPGLQLGAFLLILLMPDKAWGQKNHAIAICGSTITSSIGRCTGSAYCSVCSNCSRCAYCNSGGSCGVCSSRNSGTYYTPRRSKRSRYSAPSRNRKIYSPPQTNFNSISDDYTKTLLVNIETLNLRDGPGTFYPVIEKLNYHQELTLLATDGDWLQVIVKGSEQVGFVYSKYVVTSD